MSEALTPTPGPSIADLTALPSEHPASSSPLLPAGTKINPMVPDHIVAPGEEAFHHLVAAGVPLSTAQSWREKVTEGLVNNGADPDEIGHFWGDSIPSFAELHRLMPKNFEAVRKLYPPDIAQNFGQAIQAGLQNSNIGLIARSGRPATMTAEGAGPLLNGIASITSTLQDLPIEIGGFIAGAASAGAAGIETGPGDIPIASIGGFAGSNALEGATREALMHFYGRYPNIKNFGDFLNFFVSSLHDTLANIETGAGMGVGEGAIVKAGAALPAILRTPLALVSQGATVAAINDAMKGRVPDPQDFVGAMVVALGAGLIKESAGHVVPARIAASNPAGLVTENLRDVYAKTGVPPKLMARASSESGVGMDAVLAPRSVSGDIVAEPVLALQSPDPLPPPEPAPVEGEVIPPKKPEEKLPVLYKPRTNAEVVNDAQDLDHMGRTLDLQEENGDSWEPKIVKWEEDVAGAEKEKAELKGDAEEHKKEKGKELIAGGAGGGKDVGPPGEPRATGEPPERPQITGPSHIHLNDDMLANRILDRVVPPPKAGGFHPFLSFRRLIASFQSALTPAHRIDQLLAEKGLLKPGQLGIEDMFRQVFGAAGRAAHVIYYGGIGLREAKDNPGELEIQQISNDSYREAYRLVTKNGGTANGFLAYRLAQRALDYAKNGNEYPIGKDEASEFVNRPSVKAKYAEAEAMIQRVKHQLVDYVVDSGLMSQDAADAMIMNNLHHLVSRRLIDHDYVPSTATSKVFGLRHPIKAVKGGKQLIIDPLTTEIDNIHTMVAMADRNRARLNVIGAIEAAQRLSAGIPGFKLIGHERIGRDRMIEFEKGLEGEIIGPDGKRYPVEESPEMNEATNTFLAERRAGQRMTDPNDFIVIRNGRVEVWRAEDQDLAELMRLTWPGRPGMIGRMVGHFSNAVRLGLTLDPTFIMRAILHSELSSAAFAKFGQKIPFSDPVAGIKDMQNDELYKAFLRNGGGGALTELDRDNTREAMMRMFDNTGVNVWNRLKHPVESLRMFQHMTSDVSRLHYFKRLRNQGLSDLKAGTLSRTAYIDFAEPLAANWANSFARFVPFFQIGVKSLEQMGSMIDRAITEKTMWPAMKAVMVLSVPTALNFAVNYLTDKSLPEGQKYSDEPRWMREMYWILPPINGVRYRIKKPYAGGWTFSSSIEMMMDGLLHHDPKAASGALSMMVQQAFPPYIPSLLAPIAEQWANKSFITGRQIIPSSLEKLSNWMQFEPNTSPVARAISRWLGPPGINLANVSPIFIQNYMQNWLGTMPMNVMNELAGQGPAPADIGNNPFLHSFIARHPGMNSQPLTDFYDDYGKVTTAHADWDHALKTQNPQQMQDVVNTEGMAAFVKLTQFHNAINRMKKVVNMISVAKGMTPVEKRQYIDSIVPMAIAVAKVGDELARQLLKAH